MDEDLRQLFEEGAWELDNPMELKTEWGRLLFRKYERKKTCIELYPCTVLFDPPADANVSTLEIFGPVVCVYPYDALDEAIARANALPFAFQAAVFTRDLDTALRVYARVAASAVMINDHTAFRVDGMPFAGLRQSGLGVGGIGHSIADMQVEKMMVVKSGELGLG